MVMNFGARFLAYHKARSAAEMLMDLHENCQNHALVSSNSRRSMPYFRAGVCALACALTFVLFCMTRVSSISPQYPKHLYENLIERFLCSIRKSANAWA